MITVLRKRVINSTSGHLIPNSFVHVSCEEFEEGPIIKCNCEIYKFLRNSLQEEDNDNPELDPSTSCMYCRFFHDHLMDAYAKIISSNSNLLRPLDMVKNSLGTMCSPIILLGEPVKTGATKFSVNGNDTLAIVLHKMSQRDVWSIKHKQEEDVQICSPWPNA